MTEHTDDIEGAATERPTSTTADRQHAVLAHIDRHRQPRHSPRVRPASRGPARLAGRRRPRGRGTVAAIAFAEAGRVRDRLGRSGLRGLAAAAASRLREVDPGIDVTTDEDGRLLVVLPGTTGERARRRLIAAEAELATQPYEVAGEHLQVTPAVGYARLDAAEGAAQVREAALTALDVARSELDLLPVEYSPQQAGLQDRRPARTTRSLRMPLQIAATFVLGLGLPYAGYVAAGRLGIPVLGPAYGIIVAALVLTAVLIWSESLLALGRNEIPADPGGAYPPASAVIAAYLPNESATIVDTLEAFRRLDYPGPLQIVLAYNTPRRLPVEQALEDMAARDPRIRLLPVPGSTSKAQNVNAALSVINGRFVGIYDADHHPRPDSFRRAWQWLSAGWDIVQGHCVIRNGSASRIARTIAVEFESMYAVSHPGRERLQGFGIFGGSNGFWRTDLLRQVRMRRSMLTEDIDSSIRALERGARIASDPALISEELAPTGARALAHQRLRWAQGWFQVSRRRLRKALLSRRTSLRQKGGLLFLLGWREIYPWLSLQVFPYLAYVLLHPHAGGSHGLRWGVPLFLLSSVVTMSVGPAQAAFAYALADPLVRRHRSWFLAYVLVAGLFYTEAKNVIGRVAQLKELMGERQWKVTARQAPADARVQEAA